MYIQSDMGFDYFSNMNESFQVNLNYMSYFIASIHLYMSKINNFYLVYFAYKENLINFVKFIIT